MNAFLWHVHGSWTQAFVNGRHHSLVPAQPDGPGDWPPVVAPALEPSWP